MRRNRSLTSASVLGLLILLSSSGTAWADICEVCGLSTSVPYCPGYRVGGEHHPSEKARRSTNNPIRLEAAIREGSVKFTAPNGGPPVELKPADPPALLLDVKHLSADPKRFEELVATLEDASLEGFNGSVSFTTRAGEEAVRRWKVLPRWTEIQVQVDGQAVKNIRGYGHVAHDVLDGLRAGQPGRVLRFEVSHENGDLEFVRRLIARAENGEFRGQHLVVGVCKADMGELLVLQDAVLANGGRSCLIPAAKMQVQPMALAARELRLNPTLLADATPREALWRGYDAAAKKVWNCLQEVEDAALERTLRAEFGDDVIGLFRLNGTGSVDRAVVERVYEGLLYNKLKFLEFVDAKVRLGDRGQMVG